jgi:hypothetical protein
MFVYMDITPMYTNIIDGSVTEFTIQVKRKPQIRTPRFNAMILNVVACTPYKYVMLIYDVTINGLYIYHDITASGSENERSCFFYGYDMYSGRKRRVVASGT